MLPLFEWLDASLLAEISKAYGGVFAVVQMFHLAAMALLGGMVLVSDLRLLGVVMKDIPSETIISSTRKWFGWALVVMVVSGVFMASAVAMKLYYNEMFWAKMAALGIGILFFYFVRSPLLRLDHSTLNPWVLKLTAISSIVIWFTVAGCGRWIGFS
ncbi:MAG: hypothetical protein GXP16_18885 [Gammaproteobacteria bacterium]|nr:hypothetical protein [Gammaproteobacteria bacterium]